jgi:hypothetical protein
MKELSDINELQPGHFSWHSFCNLDGQNVQGWCPETGCKEARAPGRKENPSG